MTAAERALTEAEHAFIIDNSGALEDTERQVRELVDTLSAGAA